MTNSQQQEDNSRNFDLPSACQEEGTRVDNNRAYVPCVPPQVRYIPHHHHHHHQHINFIPCTSTITVPTITLAEALDVKRQPHSTTTASASFSHEEVVVKLMMLDASTHGGTSAKCSFPMTQGGGSHSSMHASSALDQRGQPQPTTLLAAQLKKLMISSPPAHEPIRQSASKQYSFWSSAQFAAASTKAAFHGHGVGDNHEQHENTHHITNTTNTTNTTTTTTTTNNNKQLSTTTSPSSIGGLPFSVVAPTAQLLADTLDSLICYPPFNPHGECYEGSCWSDDHFLFSVTKPGVTLQAYIKRIQDHMHCDESVFTTALAIVLRATRKYTLDIDHQHHHRRGDILAPMLQDDVVVVSMERHHDVLNETEYAPDRVGAEEDDERASFIGHHNSEHYPRSFPSPPSPVDVPRSTHHILTQWSVHRVYFTACVIAVKLLTDSPYSMSFYGMVGGVSPRELKMMELSLLKHMHYDVHMNSESFTEATQYMLQVSDANARKATAMEQKEEHDEHPQNVLRDYQDNNKLCMDFVRKTVAEYKQERKNNVSPGTNSPRSTSHLTADDEDTPNQVSA